MLQYKTTTTVQGSLGGDLPLPPFQEVSTSQYKHKHTAIEGSLATILESSVSCRQPQTYVKPEAAITVFELLMMSVVSLETC
jgi:hypothetical protein